MQQHKSSRVVGLVIPLLVLAAVAVGFWQRQTIFDWWRLRGYQAPPAVAQLAADTTMTPKAQRLFYVFHPELDDKEAFNQNCHGHEQTIVLGCYVTNQGIYLYDVQDPRLQGIKQVTAAHEMLHVAYQRLSDSERRRVNALLEKAYASVTNPRIRANVDSYRQAGDDVFNELHSILGTEVAELPPELETYYRQYFTDRAQVVAYLNAYEQEFTSRKQRVAEYDAQMDALKQQIDANQTDLAARDTALQAERQLLDAMLAAGNYQGYNAGVGHFNVLVRQYNAVVAATRAQVETYNQLVNERNQLVIEERDLVKAIDSRLQPQETE